MPYPWSARDRVNGGGGPALRCPKEIYYRCARSAGYAPQAPRFLLEAAGYTVEAFSAATDFLNADHQNITCLLLDHQMAAMTGLELAKHLKLAEAAMPIVL